MSGGFPVPCPCATGLVTMHVQKKNPKGFPIDVKHQVCVGFEQS